VSPPALSVPVQRKGESSGEDLLILSQLNKSFFGNPVLKDVSLALGRGQTLGLVGENGAGKSTLMNILGGNFQADSGTMTLMGKPYAPRNPQDASARGIAFIHQELNLFGNLSIGENLFLTAFPRHRFYWGGSIDRRSLRKRTQALLERVGLDLAPDTLVSQLSPGERQLVEIAKALSIDAQLIIFDEPTTSLTVRECEHLFRLLRQLQSSGIAAVYISHVLQDVLQMSNRIAVLRDGQVVGEGPTGNFKIDRMVSLMVGRNLSQFYPEKQVQPSRDVVLEARRLSQSGIIADISFQLHRHEILGIGGLMGSGRTELARILFGLEPCEAGTLELLGKPLRRHGPRSRIKQGLAFLSENRRDEGLCPTASIRDNMALVSLEKHVGGPLGVLRQKRLDSVLKDMAKAVGLSARSQMTGAVNQLSGGNQQKIVLAKWLLNAPAVFILDEPTRGIDVGAKYEVYRLMVNLAAAGAGVILISSEVEELMGMCDRILVMANGEIHDELCRPHFDRERFLRAALMDPIQRVTSPSVDKGLPR